MVEKISLSCVQDTRGWGGVLSLLLVSDQTIEDPTTGQLSIIWYFPHTQHIKAIHWSSFWKPNTITFIYFGIFRRIFKILSSASFSSNIKSFFQICLLTVLLLHCALTLLSLASKPARTTLSTPAGLTFFRLKDQCFAVWKENGGNLVCLQILLNIKCCLFPFPPLFSYYGQDCLSSF